MKHRVRTVVAEERRGWPCLAAPAAASMCDAIWRWHLGYSEPAAVACCRPPVRSSASPSLAQERAALLAPASDGDEARRMGERAVASFCAAVLTGIGLGSVCSCHRNIESATSPGSGVAYSLGAQAAALAQQPQQHERQRQGKRDNASAVGAHSATCLSLLFEALTRPSRAGASQGEGDLESARRAGAHGLGAAGSAAIMGLIDVLNGCAADPLVVVSAADALGESAAAAATVAAVTSEGAVDATERAVAALASAIATQEELIGAVTEEQLLPSFNVGGMVSHVNDSLQVPIMQPPSCRLVAGRYLAMAMSLRALGWIAQSTATVQRQGWRLRGELAEAVAQWCGSVCPRVQQEAGRAMLSLAAAHVAAAVARSGEMADVERGESSRSQLQLWAAMDTAARTATGSGRALAQRARQTLEVHPKFVSGCFRNKL
jgi:hypothetical protein